MLGNTTESEVGEKCPDILFELYQISPTLITSVIPFLDQKLKVCHGNGDTACVRGIQSDWVLIVKQCLVLERVVAALP